MTYTITLDDVLKRRPCWDYDGVRDCARKLGWKRASAADLLTLRGRIDDSALVWLLCDPRLWPRDTWLRLVDGWVDRTARVHVPAKRDAFAVLASRSAEEFAAVEAFPAAAQAAADVANAVADYAAWYAADAAWARAAARDAAKAAAAADGDERRRQLDDFEQAARD